MARLPPEPERYGNKVTPNSIASALQRLAFGATRSFEWSISPPIGIVARDVERLGLDIRSFGAPLRATVKTVFIPSIRKNFKVGGRPTWAPLALSTILERGATGPVLNRTGKLMRAATSYSIWRVNESSAYVYALPPDAFYGIFHQAGTYNVLSGRDMVDIHPNRVARMLKPFEHRARAELGPGALSAHVKGRAFDMFLDAQVGHELPARPFIMYQDGDIDKAAGIFYAWMEERAVKVGRFHRGW